LPAPQLRRQLGFFDATMIVMGGIVGSGIIRRWPRKQAHTPLLILGVWLIGGALLQPEQNPQPVFDLSHRDRRGPAAVASQPGLRK